MTKSSNLNEALDFIELQLDEISSALIEGHASDLDIAATRLCEISRQAYPLLSNSLHDLRRDAAVGRRIKALAASLTALREGLSRRVASVDRALMCLMPSAQPANYSNSAGLYGRPGRQSGAFTVLAA